MAINLGEVIWNQFGAALDTLENVITDCPDELWGNRSQQPEYWYTAYHTLFWLDFYLSDSPEGFAPPPPFTLDEMDPAGLLPERVYSKEELLSYLEYGRHNGQARIAALTEETGTLRWKSAWMDFSVLELHLYNLRHIQHHAAQLNLLLRQTIDSPTPWVRQAKI